MLSFVRNPRWLRHGLLAASLALAGCVPYPVYKTLQPSATATVRDAGSRPVAGARVILITSAYPYGLEKFHEVRETGADGVARFESRREWRVETLMIHGAEEFFWNWCVEKAGFETAYTTNRSADDFVAEPTFVLIAGHSEPCIVEPDTGTR